MITKKRKRSTNEGKPSTKQVHPDQVLLNQIAKREEAFVEQIRRLNISESTKQPQKPSVYEQAKLKHYIDLKDAENEVGRRRAESQGNSIGLTEFKVDGKSKVYAVGTYEEFAQLCYHWKFKPLEEVIYNKERIENNRPMKLFCEMSWAVALNSKKRIDSTLQALCDCLNLVFNNIPERSEQQIDVTSLLVAIYNDSKIIHMIVKIPEQYGVVTSLQEQKMFWSKVMEVAKQEKKTNNKSQLVQSLRAIKSVNHCPYDDWCMDTTIYDEESIFLSNVMASLFTFQKENRTYFLPVGKQSVVEVTKEEWLDHFVMNIRSGYKVKYNNFYYQLVKLE